MSPRFFILAACLIAPAVALASSLVIDTVFPNTVDDTNLEYVDITNVDCSGVDLSGFELRDLSGKYFALPSEVLGTGSVRRFLRLETKIILNNTDERLDLLDASGSVVDTFSYATSEKGIAIVTGHVVFPVCSVLPPPPPLDPIPVNPPFVPPADEPVPEILPVIPAETGIPSESGGLSETGVVDIETESIDTETGSVDIDPVESVPETGSGDIEEISSVEETGSIETQFASWSVEPAVETGAVDSGNLPESPSVPVPPSEPVKPERLILDDTDANGKIDRILIDYAIELTGSLDPTKLVLYSATGGLASYRIESSTGAIRALSISGSLLVIEPFEGDLVHPDLKINETTTSHLRLKSYVGFGLSTIDGRTPEALTYTKSFDGYSWSLIENRAIPKVVEISPQTSVSTPVLQTFSQPHTPPKPKTAVRVKKPKSAPTTSVWKPRPFDLASVVALLVPNASKLIAAAVPKNFSPIMVSIAATDTEKAPSPKKVSVKKAPKPKKTVAVKKKKVLKKKAAKKPKKVAAKKIRPEKLPIPVRTFSSPKQNPGMEFSPVQRTAAAGGLTLPLSGGGWIFLRMRRKSLSVDEESVV